METKTSGMKVQMEKVQKSKKNLIIVFLVIAIAAAFIFYLTSSRNNQETNQRGTVVAEQRSYVGKIEKAKIIQPEILDGKAMITLADVDQLNIVDFELSNSNGELLPFMAYITSSGRLFVGHSVCACGGHKFFLAGEVLVCESCRTTFTIEDQKFVSGSVTAGKNPPKRIESVIENGIIVIEQSDLGN